VQEKPINASELKDGSLIWVKLSGYPNWPARIAKHQEVGPAIRNLKHTDKHHLAYFFGTHDYCWVKVNQVTRWESGIKDKQKKNKAVQLGLREANRWLKIAESEREYPVYESDSEESDSEDDEDKEESEEEEKITWSKLRAMTKEKPSELTEEDLKLKAKRKELRMKIMQKLGFCAPSSNPDEWGAIGTVDDIKKKRKKKKEVESKEGAGKGKKKEKKDVKDKKDGKDKKGVKGKANAKEKKNKDEGKRKKEGKETQKRTAWSLKRKKPTQPEQESESKKAKLEDGAQTPVEEEKPEKQDKVTDEQGKLTEQTTQQGNNIELMQTS